MLGWLSALLRQLPAVLIRRIVYTPHCALRYFLALHLNQPSKVFVIVCVDKDLQHEHDECYTRIKQTGAKVPRGFANCPAELFGFTGILIFHSACGIIRI